MVRVSSVVTNAVNIDSKPAPEEKGKKKKKGKKWFRYRCVSIPFFFSIQTMLENKHIADVYSFNLPKSKSLLLCQRFVVFPIVSRRRRSPEFSAKCFFTSLIVRERKEKKRKTIWTRETQGADSPESLGPGCERTHFYVRPVWSFFYFIFLFSSCRFKWKTSPFFPRSSAVGRRWGGARNP